jgi:Tfp pilus assembly protein PilZ
LARPTLLYGCETWAIREQDKSRITLAEMKFMRRTAQYTWKDYKTNEDILLELKINPVVKKIHNCRNKWIQNVRRMDRDRQTDCHT